MRTHKVMATCAVLGIVVVVASAVEGSARFSGPRWVPHWNPSLQVKPHPAPSAQTQPAPQVLHQGSGHLLDTILFWVLIAVAVIVIALVASWLLRYPYRSLRRTRSSGADVAPEPTTGEPEPEPDAPVLRRGIDQALHLLEEEREPNDAVVRAWLGLEESAADAGIVRRSAETPTEFTSRVMSQVFADDHAITTLLALYLRSRFGARPVTVADVAAVRAALRELARTWEASTPHLEQVIQARPTGRHG